MQSRVNPLDLIHIDPRDSITRSDKNWSDDGFVAGKVIQVTGTNSNNGSYMIDSIVGNTLYIDKNQSIQDETHTAGILTVYGPATTINIHENSMQAYSSLAFTHVYGGRDTISRVAGSWLTDGFREGQTITISGSGSNNGQYQIATISADGKTIGLYMNNTVVTAAGVTGVTVIGSGITSGITSPVLSTEDMGVNIATEINRLQQLRVTHTGNTAAIAGYDAQITQLKMQAVELGLLDKNDPNLSDPTKSISPKTNYAVTYIVLPTITASSGNIRIDTSSLTGSGNLFSNSDTSIEIANSSPYYLRVGNTTIPAKHGGQVLFNGITVTTNADILATCDLFHIPVVSSGATNFTTISTDTGAVDPLISIRNTFNPAYALQAQYKTAAAPDIEIVGNISNLLGGLKIYNDKGSVIVKGTNGQTISAKDIDITSGRDFVLSSDSFYSAGGTPSITNGVYTTGGGTTVAGNNIFITARYLNLNGILQSGRPDRTVTLDSSMDALIDAFEADLSKGRYLTLTNNLGNSIEARYDRDTKQIVIDSVAVEGGFMQLTGQIMNTSSSAKLKAVDGYGNITINNSTKCEIVVNQLDTGGDGIEGIIKIIDTVNTIDHVTGAQIAGVAPKVTTYTRNGNDIQVHVNGVLTSTQVNSRVLATGYQPEAGQRYVYVTGTEKVLKVEKEYISSSFWGIDWLSADPGSQPDSVRVVSQSSPTPLETGTFVAWDLANTATNMYTNLIKVTLSDQKLIGAYSYTTTSGWWIFSTTYYHNIQVFSQGEKDYTNVSVKADNPIGIEFVGSDTGSVTVNSSKNVIINGSVVNKNGVTHISSTGGSITDSSDSAVVGGTSIDLSAAGGIGSSTNALLTDLNGGVLSASTTSGNIFIDETVGNLNIGTVSAGNGNITLSADDSILSNSASSTISGNSIDLTSRYGGLGTSTQSLRINSRTSAQNVLVANAINDVYLEETAGDLHLNSVKSVTGDVHLQVDNGDLIDSNTNDTRDERTIAQLQSLWSDMQLTIASGADTAAAQNITAYEGLKTREYQSYWSYRAQQADASVYDQSFQVHLSVQEITYYQSIGWSDAKIADLAAKRTTEYHDLNAIYGGLGNSFDANYAYTVVTASAEYNRLMAGSFWTEDELSTSFNPSLLRTKTDTETKIEEANISARNVFITTTNGGVGVISGSALFNLPLDSSSLTDQQKLILAAAERDDMVARDADGTIVNIFAKNNHATTLDITLHDDVDVAASGSITITSKTHVYLGSEQDINIDAIVGGDAVRIKGAAGIFDVSAGSLANVTGGGVTGGIILEAAGNDSTKGIGTDTQALVVDQLGGNLSARATNNINLNVINHDLAVDTIYSANGNVTVTAEKSILNGNADDQWNINAHSVTLVSTGGSIGTVVNALNTELPVITKDSQPGDGLITITAQNDVYLKEVSGDMNVRQITAGGDVTLTAAVSILDANNNPDPDVIANNITLNATLGGIGAAGNDLDINTSATGLLKVSSDQNIYIIETAGNLLLDQVVSTLGKAYLAAHGSILNGEASSVIRGAAAILRSDTGLGSSSDSLHTQVQNFEGTVTGDMWIHNSGALFVGGASDDPNGETTATGSIRITASSPVTVIADMISVGDNIITSTDKLATGDDITVKSGVTVQSTAGRVVLRSGDNVIIESGSVLSALGDVEIYGDYADADPGVGSIIDLHGTITGSSVQVYGNADDDLIIVPGIGVNTTIHTAGGDDRIYVGSNANQAENSGGLMSGIQAVLAVYGGAHGTGDTLVIDDSGNTGAGGGSINAGDITGFGMTGSIHYEEFENLGIALGSGDNTISIPVTVAGITTTITGGAGNDVFNVSSDASSDSGNLDGIRGDLVLVGGGGINTININDRGNTTGRGTTLNNVIVTDSSITGMTGDAGGSGVIRYSATGGFSGGINVFNGSGDDYLTFESTLSGVATIIRAGAGDDVITATDTTQGRNGQLEVFGEGGSDTVNGAAWQSDMIAFGDDGVVLLSPDNTPLQAYSTNPHAGDYNTLIGGSGNNVLIGGTGNDELIGGAGNNVLIGDGGTVSWDAQNITSIKSIDPSHGGNDSITTGSGRNTIIGGFGNDTIRAIDSATNSNIVLGDNGELLYAANGLLSSVRTTDTTEDSGGDDTVTLGNGSNVVLGGMGSDTIVAGSGFNILIGDNGAVYYRLDGNTVSANVALTTLPGLGGNDVITSGSGNDVLIGGTGNDVLNGGDGNNVLIGDGGKIVWKTSNSQVIESIDPLIGGADTLVGGSGNNIMIGGAGNDRFFGDLKKDLMLGETGQVVMKNGMVQGVTVINGAPRNLLAFTQSGLFDSGQRQGNGYLATTMESAAGTRPFVRPEATDTTIKIADKSEMWQTKELSYHSTSMLTSQNMQQIIDFFQEFDPEDTGSEVAGSVGTQGNADDGTVVSVSEVLDDQVIESIIGVGIRSEKVRSGQQHPHIVLKHDKKAENTPAVEKENDNLAFGTLVAGYMGWNVNSSLPSERKVRINRDSFTKLEQQERNRRFQKWN